MAPTNLYIIIAIVFSLVIGYDIYNWSRNRTFVAPEIRNQRFKKAINSSILVLSITLIIVSIAFHINIFKYSFPIEHSHYGSITLKDFKGYKKPYQTLDGSHKFAFITTSIESRKINNGLEIKALFHPSRSYTFNENAVDKFLLQHELYHFHITEYFARQIRMDLTAHQNQPSGKVIKSIIAKYLPLEDAMQRDYDNETYHGFILKEQKQWMHKIDSLLTSHQNFSDTKILY